MTTTSSRVAMLAAWTDAAGPGAASHSCFERVLERYGEPHRRYHGLAHVDHVVSDARSLGRTVGVHDPIAVTLAAFFHDAIYDPRSTGNEADSASLAKRELSALGLASTRCDEITRLIMLTAAHIDPTADAESGAMPSDPDGDVLLDADLAVLGSEPAVYSEYVRGVRSEYAHVADSAWVSGRSTVLHRFLDRSAVYRTEPMASRERQARANLTAELRSLAP